MNDELGLFKVSKEEVLKRVKSFLWRIGMMSVALLIDFLIINLSDINIPMWVVVPIGLALGEWSKQIHKNLNNLKNLAGIGMGKVGRALGKASK